MKKNSSGTGPNCQQLVDSFPDPYLLIGTDFRIVLANRAYRQIYDPQGRGVVGRDCFEVSGCDAGPCDAKPAHCPMHQVMLSAAAVRVVERHKGRAADDQRVQITASPLFDDHGELAFVSEMIVGLGDASDADLLIGHSRAMVELRAQLDRVAPTPTTVMLLGESGAGKDCSAQYLHQASDRAAGPFLVVDCGTLSAQRAEADLFGIGQTTPAHDGGDALGFFAQADGGTLLIDEISELPLQLQSRLLRVLERGEIKPVGSARYRRVDVRVIVACNRDPGELVAAGRLRKDLYYRLTAFPIRVPPLRHHLEDLPLLVEHFLRKMGPGTQELPLPAALVTHLMGYDYPGNVRELRNVVERAVIYAAGERLRIEHLVFDRDLFGMDPELPIPVDVLDNEHRLIARRGYRPGKAEMVAVLRECHGHRATAARRLGMSERTLYRYLKSLRDG